MKILLLVLLVSAQLVKAQFNTASNTPDCFFSEVLTTATRTSGFDNRSLKCNTWRIQVVNLSNASASYQVESSSNNSSWNQVGFTTSVATVTAGSLILSTQENYVSVRLISKGTGNVIISASGFAYPASKNNVNSDAPSAVAYTTLRDVASATVTYIGSAKSIFDPVTNTSYAITAIQKLTYNATPELTSVQWADGDTEEDNVWANRASLTYK